MGWKIEIIDIKKVLDFKNPPIKQWMAIIGSLLIIIGVFLPWLSGTVTGYLLHTGTESDSYSKNGLDFGLKGKIVLFFGFLILCGVFINIYKDGELFILENLINIDIPFKKKQVTRLLSLLLCTIVFLIIVISLRDVIQEADTATYDHPYGDGTYQIGEANSKIGIWICLIASVITELGIFLWIQEESFALTKHEESEIEYDSTKTELEKTKKKADIPKKKRKSKREVLEEFLKIQGVGKAKAEKLYEAGYRSLEELKNADVDDIAEVKGFTRASAKRLLDNL